MGCLCFQLQVKYHLVLKKWKSFPILKCNLQHLVTNNICIVVCFERTDKVMERNQLYCPFENIFSSKHFSSYPPINCKEFFLLFFFEICQPENSSRVINNYFKIYSLLIAHSDTTRSEYFSQSRFQYKKSQ